MTTDWKLLDREQRGVLLAAMVKITHRQPMARSESVGNGRKYAVNPDERSPFCSCPDFEINGHTCKHIYAVRLVRQRELFEDGSEVVTESLTIEKTVRKTYPQQWPAYNRAQTTEKETFQKLLAALCEGIQEPVQEGRGRRRIRLSDAVFACCFKVYSTLSGRRFISDLKAVHEKGHIGCVPHFNSIFNHLDDQRMGTVLRDLIARSSEPLSIMDHDFAVDSTGFMVSRFHRWFDEKYGKLREKHDSLVQAHDVGDDFAERGSLVVRPHQGDLRTGVRQHPRRDRVTLGRVGVEQLGRCPSVDDGRELPAQVHRVEDAEIQSLAAERRVNVPPRRRRAARGRGDRWSPAGRCR